MAEDPRWYACQHPERVTTDDTLWHGRRCHGCRIKVDAVRRQRLADGLLHDVMKCEDYLMRTGGML